MTIATNAWNHPRTGETRHYINGLWTNLLGLEIERYNTGNIRSATIDGEWISNSKARRLRGKIWADDNGSLHIDYFNGAGIYTEDEALAKASAKIAEKGGLDFLQEK